MEKTIEQVEKNVSASFGYVKKDMLMLNDAFSDLHDKMQHLSLNHATLLAEIEKLKKRIAVTPKKTPVKKVVKKTPVKKVVKKTPVKKKDDLTKIEGIGPVIRELLYKNKIMSFKKLANSSPANLRKVLDKAGPKFQMHDPSTWVRQANLAAQGKWSELEKLQEKLNKRIVKKTPVKKKTKKVVTSTKTTGNSPKKVIKTEEIVYS
jgi:predicted flap endonuclease-1-like 5' DNA nuclease